jgi:hypothetical protein
MMKLRDWINKDKIIWTFLSKNHNAIELIKDNLDKISWELLSKNPNAIEMLKENPDKIDWFYLSENPSIFTYDYERIKQKNKDLNEEITYKALHPKRMLRLMEEYGEDEIYNCYFNDE